MLSIFNNQQRLNYPIRFRWSLVQLLQISRSMKNSFIFIYLISICTACNKSNSLLIKGAIKGIDSGVAQLLVSNGNSNIIVSEKNVTIKNGKFTFKGEIDHTDLIFLKLSNSEKSFFTFWFYVDRGEQVVKLDTSKQTLFGESMAIEVVSTGESFIEYKEKLEPLLSPLNEKKNDWLKNRRDLYHKFNDLLPLAIYDSMDLINKSIQSQMSTIVFNYIKTHPSCYVSLNEADNEIDSEYRPVFDSIFNSLDSKIKLTPLGFKIKQRLKTIKSISVGNNFPEIPLIDNNNSKISLDISVLKQYTLLEIWSNNWPDCIPRMPELNKIYSKWNNKGVEVISINVDSEEEKEYCKNTISKQKVKYLQLWDVNGVETKKLSIRGFPTNFLLDKSGKIIAVNIKLNEIEQFLASKL